MSLSDRLLAGASREGVGFGEVVQCRLAAEHGVLPEEQARLRLGARVRELPRCRHRLEEHLAGPVAAAEIPEQVSVVKEHAHRPRVR